MSYKDKEKNKEYNKQYRKLNSERIKEMDKQWRLKNPDKIKKYDKQKRINNPEKYRELHKQWKINNHEKVLEDKKIQYRKNPKRHMEWAKNNIEKTKLQNRKSVLKRRYGLSVEQYNKMFNDQNGCCDICGKHQSECKQRLQVDHNHTTGAVRGLLCWNCNSMLGKVYEDVTILRNMILYLKKDIDEYRSHNE